MGLLSGVGIEILTEIGIQIENYIIAQGLLDWLLVCSISKKTLGNLIQHIF